MNILTENEINIKSLEKEIYDYACKLAAKVFSNFLEVLDQEPDKVSQAAIKKTNEYLKDFEKV